LRPYALPPPLLPEVVDGIVAGGGVDLSLGRRFSSCMVVMFVLFCFQNDIRIFAPVS